MTCEPRRIEIMTASKQRRNTPQRKAILAELCALKTHPTAGELYDIVRKKLPRVSLGTVYRNLEVLHEDGLIAKLEFSGVEARFDGTVQPHHHLRCTSCGCVRDLPPQQGIPTVPQPRYTQGFQITGHRLEYFGICPDCQGAGGAPNTDKSATN